MPHSSISTFIVALFTTSIVIAMVSSNKLVMLAGYPVPAGVLAYSITFLSTDIVSELYGKKAANKMVLAGGLALFMGMGYLQLVTLFPAAFGGTEFDTVLSGTPRIALASIIAYLLSQFLDVSIFHWLKHRTKGRFFWLRNNVSTILSQLIDSAIFVSIAFFGALPIGEMILTQFFIKLVIALVDTPFAYLLVGLLKGQNRTTSPYTA